MASPLRGEFIAVTDDALGAWPKGTRIRKTERVGNDSHGVGAQGTIVGSIGPADIEDHKNLFGYFVEWDDTPGIPVFVVGFRIQPVEGEGPEVPIDARERCDFCVQDDRFKPTRVFRCYDFVVPHPFEDKRNTVHVMTGGWAACQACAGLIDRENWEDLQTRTVDLFCEKKHIFGLDQRSDVRKAISWSHELFRRYRVRG